MSATLFDILKCNMINVGDSIQFTFKNHYFKAKIIRGGLISDCTVFKPCLKKVENILVQHSSFSSLTSWTEACLQEVLEEYFTRYSSWKRVYHIESGRTLGELRDRCKLLNATFKEQDNVELYKEIYRLQQTIKDMTIDSRKNNLFKNKWSIFPFVKIKEDIQFKAIKKEKLRI